MKRSFPTKDGSSSETQSKRKVGDILSSICVTPIQKYCGECPYFREPAEFGHFSLDGKRDFHNNASQLRYYVPPMNTHNLSFDLRKGYDTCILKDEEIQERLTHLLTWIKKNRQKFQLNNQSKSDDKSKDKRLNTDFISWRGHFTKFLCTPYEKREPWKIAATLFNGTIFLSEVETEKAKKDRLHRSPRHHEMCYWGYKFEDYTTQPVSDKKDEEDDDIVNTNEAYCSVVRTRLNKHSILIGAEVDCCLMNNSQKPPANYIELKTTRIMYKFKQKANFARYKLLKFWAQSFLAGIPKIVVGMRNDDGVVSQITSYETLNIPHVSKQHSNEWDASVCMNFLDALLTWLKEEVTQEGPDIVYMIHFEYPFEKISIKLVDDGSERFLPDWFVSG